VRAEIRPAGDDRAQAAAELERVLAAARGATGPEAEVVAMAAAPPAAGAPPADWIAWHDRLIAAFNKLETR
jgi:hypothetical protein